MNTTEEANARTMILATIYREASLAREGNDRSKTATVFETNAIVRFPGGREVLATQLGEITRGNPPKLLRHHLTTIDVEFISSDEAQCQSFVIAGTDVKMPDHWGTWDYVMKKQANGRWLIKQKVVTVDGLDPAGWLARFQDHESST